MIGSEVWHISVYDGDGDTITLTTAFAPAVACAGLFSVNAAGTYTRGDQKVRGKVLLNHIAFIDFNENS